MDLEQLKCVLAVAKHQHFSKAADDICISQSSLSKHINKLEDELGVRLFDRNTRTVRLTPAGKEFLNHARKIMADIDHIRDVMQEFSMIERGQIVLGTVPILGYRGLNSFMASFQALHPGITLKIKEAESKALLELRRAMEIDVAFITLTDDYELHQKFKLHPLFSEEVVLVTNKSHGLAARETVDLSETANEKYILGTHNSSFADICLAACGNAGFKPRIVHESSYFDTVMAFVSAGIGVTLISRHLSDVFSQRFDIVPIRLEQRIVLTVALALPRDLYLTPSIHAFKKFVLKWFKRDA